ncbi:MAG: mechanosensitive ion channel family protein [Methylococcales bacterium]|nr:mechanosensitive ion channel family protein [Methylococcales bacterium]
MPAIAGEENPLKPIDTSSPRATLQGFLEFMDKGFGQANLLVDSILATSNTYLTPEQEAALQNTIHLQESAQRTLDTSALPPAIVHETSRRLAIQMKEVLDRVALPPAESIPDAESMAKAELKRWTIPGTEIQIAKVTTGPRTGEYLFTPETLGRLPEFYAKVRDLPYKPGASVGWYDFSTFSPVGVAIALHRIMPPRWLLEKPQHRTRTLFLDQPVWRWFGIFVVFGAGFAAIRGFFRLSHYLARKLVEPAGHWLELLPPLSIVAISPVVVVVLAEVLRVSEILYEVVTRSLWTVFFLALTWLVWVAGGVVAESMISVEKLRTSSIDSQLIRLMLRLVTIIAAIAILVKGADRIGLPAYSVLAGLGVGGLAVALAAQQTLANLLGSLIIMFEKPFAVGHAIKLKDFEGTVENVGFRSTRIRTTSNSVVTIPSSLLVNSPIDNMALRQYRQVKTVLNLTYDTPRETLEDFLEGIKHILLVHPDTRKDNIQAVLYDLGPDSLSILLNFFVRVPDRSTELNERQRVLLDILSLAEAKGIRFTLPTQS